MRDAIATFDLETAKVLPADVAPTEHMPLGIAVAAVRLPSGKTRFWHGGTERNPAAQMNRDECAALVRDLEALAGVGTRIATWNGAGFDFLVLAHESGLRRDCARLARDHIDLMFHFFCAQGYPVSLQAVAEPLGLGKTAGLSGADVPAAWRRGEHARVKRYLAGDVSLVASVYAALARDGRLSWVTQKGRVRRWDARRPLTVAEAMRLPDPDTSWMDRPIARDQFCGWIRAAR